MKRSILWLKRQWIYWSLIVPVLHNRRFIWILLWSKGFQEVSDENIRNRFTLLPWDIHVGLKWFVVLHVLWRIVQNILGEVFSMTSWSLKRNLLKSNNWDGQNIHTEVLIFAFTTLILKNGAMIQKET